MAKDKSEKTRVQGLASARVVKKTGLLRSAVDGLLGKMDSPQKLLIKYFREHFSGIDEFLSTDLDRYYVENPSTKHSVDTARVDSFEFEPGSGNKICRLNIEHVTTRSKGAAYWTSHMDFYLRDGVVFYEFKGDKDELGDEIKNQVIADVSEYLGLEMKEVEK